MANPKRKTSRSKRDMRRAHWMGSMTEASIIDCPNCGEKMKTHHACASCGYYRGEKVIESEEK